MATAPARGRALPAAADAAAETTRALYERYSRQIFAYCLVQLRNREEAEDAVQSTFLNAFRGLERGVLPELESAWLYKIAQHVCLTRQRSWSRRRLVESPQELETATRLLGAPAHDGDEIAGLTEALRELPEQQRRAILLREWQGLTYKEIADELQVSQAAVETLIFRARRGLARSLEKLRAMTDLGSLAAALKSLLIGGGTKVAAALVTVATTSVVAATPAARHGVVHFVDAVAGTAPPARTEVRPRPKPSPPPKPVAVAVAPTVSPVKRHASSRPVAPKPVAVRATTKAPVDHATPPPAVVHHEPPPKQTVDPTPAPAAATTPATTTTAAPAPPPPAVDTPTTPAGVTKAPVPVPAPVAPSISGFTPASGAPGTVVQVIGKSFTGATAVRFNGTSADFTVTSDGQVTTRVPAAATSGPIAIVTPTGTVTSDASFTVTTTTTTPTATTPATTTTGTPPPVAPSVSGVSPSSGPPGTIVQIAGAHLTGTNAVRFGDATADFTVVSDAQITAKVPTSAASGPITVVTSQGTASAGSFTVTAAAPTIDGFTPRIGPVGSSVILVGHNFAGATGVSLNGTAAAFKVDSDTQLTFDVPPGATSGPVSVTTPNGTVTSSTTFTVGTPPPEISGFSPASGAVGSSVGIGGTRFTGATSVKFNGVAASFSVSSDGLITAVVPAGATSGTVTVTTPAGTATSSTSFTVTH